MLLVIIFFLSGGEVIGDTKGYTYWISYILSGVLRVNEELKRRVDLLIQLGDI